MPDLSWLEGKMIVRTAVQRAGEHLELVLGVHQNINEFVIELRHPDNRDWFETEEMSLEEMVNRVVARTETIVRQATSSERDYTYRLWFTDGTYIDIFADARAFSSVYDRDVQIRDRLYFSVRNPEEESWEGTEILDELDADLERVRQAHESQGEGELLPQYRYHYLNHF